MRRRMSVVLVVLGVLLLVAGAAVRWVAAPALAVLPGDTDTTRTYQGTAAVLLDPEAVSAGSGEVVLRDVPITVVSRSEVLDTDGDDALVEVSRTVEAGGRKIADTAYRYAVDRTDLQEGSGFDDVVDHEGITFNWPIRTKKQDYTGWVPDTGRTTQLEYVRTEDRLSTPTYVFTTRAEAQPITDEQVLSTLPPTVPKIALTPLMQILGLPAEQRDSLARLLPSLPDAVPFSYTYELEATYWVEPDSGVVVDVEQRQVRVANLAAGPTPVPIAPISDFTFTSTPQSRAEAATDGGDKGGAVRLVYERLPLGLALLGVVLLLAGAVGLVTGRRRPPAAQARHAEPAPVS